MKNKNYKLIPHPADICVEVHGKNLKELFLNSAEAMISELGKIKKKSGTKNITIKINGVDRESLLVNWLQELLYNFYVMGLIFLCGKIKKLTEKELSADVKFLKFKEGNFVPVKEIKAVTYHDVLIKRENKNLSVRIVFDI